MAIILGKNWNNQILVAHNILNINTKQKFRVMNQRYIMLITMHINSLSFEAFRMPITVGLVCIFQIY